MTAPAASDPRENPDTELAEALASAVLVIDPSLGIHYLNAAAEDLFGLSRRRAVGVPLAELARIDPVWLQHAGAAIGNDETFTAREVALTPIATGQALHADIAVTPWRSGRWGAVAAVELRPLDRHLRIAREEALRAQEQANRALLRGLGHEIRNPLAGLRGAAQLLEREIGDTDLTELTRVIVHEADRLGALVDRMVAPARPPAPARVNIHEVTEHVRRLLRAEAAPGVKLTTEYDPSLPDLSADRDQIVQALLNLGRNALQAVGDSGRVALRTHALRRFTIGTTLHRLVAAIEVADDGPGVPESLRETLFQPMVSGRADGSGLGLTIAQSLVSRHGGLVECDSSPAGTTFRALLPLEPADG